MLVKPLKRTNKLYSYDPKISTACLQTQYTFRLAYKGKIHGNLNDFADIPFRFKVSFDFIDISWLCHVQCKIQTCEL